MDASEVINNLDNESSIAEKLETDVPKVDEKNKTYGKEDREKRAFIIMNTMKKRDLFCDVTLKVEGGSDIRAHKMILASCSPYFYEVFTNLDEREQQRIKIEDIQHSTLKQLIDYIYSSEIFITEENVQILYHAANFLQLTDICDACCEFIRNQLKPSYCLKILDFAESNECEELLSFTKEYVEKNFWQIVKHDEFLTLPLERISQLISSDYLAVPFEETIFESVISWVNFDLENRKKYVAELMEHVRMPLLSRKYLVERVEAEPLLKINMQCQQFIIEAQKYHLLDDEQKTLSQTLRTKHRQPHSQSKVLIVVGGFCCKSTANVLDECYDFEKEKWYQVSKLNKSRYTTRLAVVEGRIYKIGDPYDESFNVYDFFTEKWSKCRDMTTTRIIFGVAVLDNCIYVVGGRNDEKSVNSVEFYNPRENKWQMIQKMSVKRDLLGVEVINGLLYAVGGYDSESEKLISSAECYDPKKGEWKSIASMSTPRCEFGVGVIDDILYAVGGWDGISRLRSVETYNPATNEWKFVAEMSQCRRYPGVAVFNGMLYVVGGHDGNSHLSSVEVFSPATNSWTTLPSSMKIGRFDAGVIIIDKMQAPPALMLDYFPNSQKEDRAPEEFNGNDEFGLELLFS